MPDRLWSRWSGRTDIRVNESQIGIILNYSEYTNIGWRRHDHGLVYGCGELRAGAAAMENDADI